MTFVGNILKYKLYFLILRHVIFFLTETMNRIRKVRDWMCFLCCTQDGTTVQYSWSDKIKLVTIW